MKTKIFYGVILFVYVVLIGSSGPTKTTEPTIFPSRNEELSFGHTPITWEKNFSPEENYFKPKQLLISRHLIAWSKQSANKKESLCI